MDAMTVSHEQGQMLASLALALRPPNAPRWDAPGVLAAIKRVAHLGLGDVTRAVTRAAEDHTAKTPAVIAILDGPAWRDRVTPEAPAREPYNPGHFCSRCAQPEDRCRRLWADDHEFESVAAAKDRRRSNHDTSALRALVSPTRPSEEAS